MQPEDLQPRPKTIKIKDKDYRCKPMRMSHRLIIARLKPLFEDMERMSKDEKIELSADEILTAEHDIDVLVKSLVPDLQIGSLELEDTIELLAQIVNNSLPEEAQQLKEAKIEVNKDPKVMESTTG